MSFVVVLGEEALHSRLQIRFHFPDSQKLYHASHRQFQYSGFHLRNRSRPSISINIATNGQLKILEPAKTLLAWFSDQKVQVSHGVPSRGLFRVSPRSPTGTVEWAHGRERPEKSENQAKAFYFRRYFTGYLTVISRALVRGFYGIYMSWWSEVKMDKWCNWNLFGLKISFWMFFSLSKSEKIQSALNNL